MSEMETWKVSVSSKTLLIIHIVVNSLLDVRKRFPKMEIFDINDAG